MHAADPHRAPLVDPHRSAAIASGAAVAVPRCRTPRLLVLLVVLAPLVPSGLAGCVADDDPVDEALWTQGLPADPAGAGGGAGHPVAASQRGVPRAPVLQPPAPANAPGEAPPPAVAEQGNAVSAQGDAGGPHVAEGFRVEAVLRGLTYPSSVEIDDDGNLWVAEAGYSYGDPTATPRIFCVSPAGAVRIAAQQGLHGPVTDLLWHGGRLFVSHRGSIATLGDDGSVREVVGGLPSDGDHQNNQLTAGADGWLYFGQGTATNSGVVGPDNARMGWLRQHPELHDIPARDVRLAEGAAFESANPLTADESDTVTTAAFHAFGETAGEDAALRGATKANGAILRVRPDGSGLEVFAWGLRNPFGVAWSPDRVLFATENGFDARGSRPIANDQEDVYVIEQGAFYGWPDFASGVPVTDARFRPEGEEQPEFLLREHPEVASPWLSFPKHAAICKLDFASSDAFGKGRMFVAFFGHMTPMTGEAPQQHGGHRVVAIDVRSRQVEAFLVRAHHDDEDHGKDDARGDLQRPVDVRFAPDGRALYVVDFGELHMRDGKPHPVPGTGVVWRIQPAGDDPVAPPAGLRAPH